MLALLTVSSIPLDTKYISSQLAINFHLYLNQVKWFFSGCIVLYTSQRDSSSNHSLTKLAEILLLLTLLLVSFLLSSTSLKSPPITIWLLPTDCTLKWMS